MATDDEAKRSPVEGIKESSRWLRGTLADELASDADISRPNKLQATLPVTYAASALATSLALYCSAR